MTQARLPMHFLGASVPVPPARATPSPSHGVLQLSSQQLFKGASEVQIEHNGAVYRLKQTSLGKLILTK